MNALHKPDLLETGHLHLGDAARLGCPRPQSGSGLAAATARAARRKPVGPLRAHLSDQLHQLDGGCGSTEIRGRGRRSSPYPGSHGSGPRTAESAPCVHRHQHRVHQMMQISMGGATLDGFWRRPAKNGWLRPRRALAAALFVAVPGGLAWRTDRRPRPLPWPAGCGRSPICCAVPTTLGWGGNAVASRMAVGQISPMTLTSARWGIVLVLLLIFRRRPVAREVAGAELRQQWRLHVTLLMGASGFTLFNALNYVAAHYTSAVNLSITQGTVPLLVLLGGLDRPASRPDQGAPSGRGGPGPGGRGDGGQRRPVSGPGAAAFQHRRRDDVRRRHPLRRLHRGSARPRRRRRGGPAGLLLRHGRGGVRHLDPALGGDRGGDGQASMRPRPRASRS